jgi:hypothetical protein
LFEDVFEQRLARVVHFLRGVAKDYTPAILLLPLARDLFAQRGLAHAALPPKRHPTVIARIQLLLHVGHDVNALAVNRPRARNESDVGPSQDERFGRGGGFVRCFWWLTGRGRSADYLANSRKAAQDHPPEKFPESREDCQNYGAEHRTDDGDDERVGSWCKAVPELNDTSHNDSAALS